MTDFWTPKHPLLDPFRKLTPQDDYLASRRDNTPPGVLGLQAPAPGIGDLLCSTPPRGPIGTPNDRRVESDLFLSQLQGQRDSLRQAINTLKREVYASALAKKQTWDNTPTLEKGWVLLGAFLQGVWDGFVPDVDIPDEVTEALQAGWEAFNKSDFLLLSQQAKKLWHSGQAKLANAMQVLSLVALDPPSQKILLDFCAYYARTLGIVETVHATAKAIGAVLFAVAATLALGMVGIGLAVAIQGSRVLVSIGLMLRRIAELMARLTGHLMASYSSGASAKKNRQISGNNTRNKKRANRGTNSQTPSQLSGGITARQEDTTEDEVPNKTTSEEKGGYNVPNNKLSYRTTDFIGDVGDDDIGRLGGKLYSAKKLAQLEEYLAKRGIELRVGDQYVPYGKAGGFDSQNGVLFLKNNPTNYEVWHELSHFRQYQKIGREEYLSLPRTKDFNAPEQFVFDMLENSPKRWDALNFDEQQHAIKYIERIGGFR